MAFGEFLGSPRAAGFSHHDGVDMGAYDIPSYEWDRPVRQSCGTAS
jgi:hypothetical protein